MAHQQVIPRIYGNRPSRPWVQPLGPYGIIRALDFTLGAAVMDAKAQPTTAGVFAAGSAHVNSGWLPPAN